MHSFYFVRHGETDFNINPHLDDGSDIALNAKGRSQAAQASFTIANLSIKTICMSPLRRAVETAHIVSHPFDCSLVTIDELEECSGEIWHNMAKGNRCAKTQAFMQRALKGIELSLKNPGPVLVVAHGGVFWAFYHLAQARGHKKDIQNGEVVHFFQTSTLSWRAALLS